MISTYRFSKSVTMVLIAGAVLAIFTACGGSDDSSSSTATTIVAPTATSVASVPTVTLAATATPAPDPTATQAPDPTATTAAAPTQATGDGAFDDPTGQFDQELLAIGKVIFDETAGGIGCAFCHGLDGKGNGPAGIGAPPNRGLDMSSFKAALTEGESGAMEFLDGQLTTSEKKAVVEYLGWLGTQP